MSVNEIFKTEFKGYNKKEVVDYIMSLNSQMQSLKNELDRCESELNKCKAELDETETRPRELTEEEMDAIRESLREEIAASIKEKYRQMADEQQQLLKAREEQAETLTVSKAEYEELSVKAGQYDNQKDILAELMIKVKSDAEQIYAEAESKSNKLLSEAFDKFVKLQSDFEEMKRNVIASKEDIDSRMNNIHRALDDFNQYLGFMSQDINNTAENFKQDIK